MPVIARVLRGKDSAKTVVHKAGLVGYLGVCFLMAPESSMRMRCSYNGHSGVQHSPGGRSYTDGKSAQKGAALSSLALLCLFPH